MLNQLKINKIIWLILSLMALLTSAIGVFDARIYELVVQRSIIPGVISQDVMVLLAAVTTLILIPGIKEDNWKKEMIVCGLVTTYFYGYGIYAIERVYTPYYFLYLLMFGLSLYALVFSALCIKMDFLRTLYMNLFVRFISAAFLFFNIIIFVPKWVGELLLLINNAVRPEFLYSIYILDLSFIMPMILFAAVMLVLKNGIGLVLTPILFIHGFTLLGSVGMGEFFKPRYGFEMDSAGLILYLGLGILFLVLSFAHLGSLKTKQMIFIQYRHS